ncbi:glycosyltransferase family 1 protein [Breoghania sp. L-A4]|nr:glycosyltransferase family 1 protein [Breoghania sp. L-A4]
MIGGLRALGWHVEALPLGDPHADRDAKARALSLLRSVPHDTPLVIDGLAFGILPDEAEALSRERAIIALVHHPLALETGLDAAQQAALRDSETRSLKAARAVIVSSPATAEELVRDFGVARSKITVVVPGTDRAPLAAPRAHDGIVRLVSVGSLVPRKGHDVLIKALAALRALPWRLDIAGGDRLDPGHANLLRDMVATEGLGGRVTLRGALSAADLDALYAQADVFVLATRYEGYGMAFAEATVRGLPIVATGAGAVAQTIAPGTGLLYDPFDTEGFGDGLRRMIGDADLRARCAAASRDAAHGFPDWEATAALFAKAVENATPKIPADEDAS